MPGVFRPYTLVDVLGQLNQQSSVAPGDTINGFGDFAEADENNLMTDTITLSHATNPTWDNGTWGTVVWS